MIKITKSQYLRSFGYVVIILALVRCAWPGIASSSQASAADADSINVTEERGKAKDTLAGANSKAMANADLGVAAQESFDSLTGRIPHPIHSVPSYRLAFPDSQDVQIASAEKYGVKPVKDRLDAEKRKNELVYVGANPYYYVEKLNNSIPYLVPRAAILLNEIGRNFYDSLYVKGLPLHKIIVTSVLRTQDDVVKLRARNRNATENSCHMYGTTVDICYNRYKTVQSPDGPRHREVRNDTLKWVLSEVLRDLREKERAYIKYEVKQGCFHLTVR